MRRWMCFFLAVCSLLTLCACGQAAPEPEAESPEAPVEEPQEPEAPPEPEPYSIYDPTVMPEGGSRDGVTYAAYDGIVEHLFFHPVVAYPELAFDGDAQADGIDDFMVTADEYRAILQSVYDRGYVLVDIADVWSETTDENGNAKMVKNTLYLPEGKKPLILSFDDTNYYEYMLSNGFAWKLVIGEDGKIASYGKDPQGAEVVSRDLDAIPILDKFVEEHPDFSPFGAKGCLSLTGYEGILGYRTQTESETAELRERSRRAAAEREERLVSAAQMEARKTALAARQEMVDKAYDLALEKLCSLPEEQYIQTVAALLVQAAPDGKGEVIFSKEQRERVGTAAVALANSRLGDGKLTVSAQTRPLKGGFILSNGRVEVNCSFDTLVRLQRAETAGEVAKRLFPQT